MRHREIKELHNIMPINNVASVMRQGILCLKRAKRLEHTSVALDVIQKRRADRHVPDGRTLHAFADLYFNARNPMMYRRRNKHNQLCVLRIDPSVLELPGVVVTDGNASSDYTYFGNVAQGLRRVDKELVFAENWTDSDEIVGYNKKRAKCAEVLIPEKVKPEYIVGAYVSGVRGQRSLEETGFALPITTNAHIFFVD